MSNPIFQVLSIRLACTALLAATVTLRAEPPENRPNKTRTKPQIIYHLPPSSPYAERLHSQAKGQNSDLSNDNLPLSLQTPHPTPNAAPAPQQQSPISGPSEHNVKPRERSSRAQPRSRSFAKPSSHGNGNGNGNHSHKN
jgi:hypothetical protein